jgi:hypothetical protein
MEVLVGVCAQRGSVLSEMRAATFKRVQLAGVTMSKRFPSTQKRVTLFSPTSLQRHARIGQMRLDRAGREAKNNYRVPSLRSG